MRISGRQDAVLRKLSHLSRPRCVFGPVEQRLVKASSIFHRYMCLERNHCVTAASPKIYHVHMSTHAKPHEERTALEPRDDDLHEVMISKVHRVNDHIRIFRLDICERDIRIAVR